MIAAPLPRKMDDLISLLRHNARASIEDLAKELNATPAAIEERIARLESDGVLLGYQAVVDPAKVSAGVVTAAIEVSITPERGGGFDRLAQRISKFSEVQSCYLMSGGYDLLVIVEGSTLQEVASFISEKLSTIKGVISTATRFRMKAYKENGLTLMREASPTRLAVSP
jgi:DNA-binding Lrp family transcriptional regulator